jgi:integrase
MEKYMDDYSARNKAPRTHERDKSLKKHLVDFFGNLPLLEIAPSLIAEYKTSRRKEGAAPKTVNNELVLMSHAFNLAIKDWEWVRENPVKKVSREKVNNQIERWLTPDEEKRLSTFSPRWLNEITAFAISTGLRQGEILDLQWPQIDFSRGTLTILQQKNKGKDTLPLNRKALRILKERARARQSDVDYVFYNGNAKRMDARDLLRAFYSATEKAKVHNLRFHDLRHTFATRLVQGGVDIYTVQKLGRWKTISMVMRYAHHYPESLRSGIEVLDKVGKKVSTNLAQSNKKGATRTSQPLDFAGSGAWI